jgi:hypothetical protein
MEKLWVPDAGRIATAVREVVGLTTSAPAGGTSAQRRG